MLKKMISNSSGKFKAVSIILCLVLLAAATIAGTYAWRGSSSALNEFKGEREDYSITLNKLERDAQGNETNIPVADAEFLLYRIISEEPLVKEQVGVLYRTDASGKIEVPDLLVGRYYFEETNPSYSYDYDKEADGETNKTKYSFEAKKDAANEDKVIEVKAFNRKLEASLQVEKTVVFSDGSAISEEQASLSFEFSIVFGNGKDYKYTISDGTNTSEEKTLKNGKFSLKHGEVATFLKVPVGVTYTVTETAGDGYRISSANHTGNIGKEGNKATFTNEFEKQDDTGLIITKAVTGTTDATDLDTSFVFEVIIGGDLTVDYTYDIYDANGKIDTKTIKSTETITLKHGQRAVFTGIAEGTIYKVTEQDATGFKALHKTIEGQVLEAGASVDFVNAKEQPPVEDKFGKLIVTKEVIVPEGEEFPTDKTFHFTIRVGNQTFACDLKHGETYEILDILAGTAYEVVEDDYSTENYATTSTNSNGTIVEGDNTASFVNTLTTPGEEEQFASLIVEKIVVGGDTDKEFIFYVTVGNAAPQEIKLKHGEIYEIPNILVGTTYRVSEADYTADGYVTTSSGASGTIAVTGSKATYTNTYNEIAEETGKLTVMKIVTGIGNHEHDFNFNVTFSDGKQYPYTYEDDGASGTAGIFTLRSGQKVLFDNLPADITYEIVEDHVLGYLQGVTKQNGSIVANQSSDVRFVNHLPDTGNEEKEGWLVIKKMVTGDGADLDKNFEFTITVDGVAQTFKLKNGETKDLKFIVGKTYVLTEKDYLEEGYVLKTIAKGTGTIVDGFIEIDVENEYVAPVLIDLTGTKTWVAPYDKIPTSIEVSLKNGDITIAKANATKDSEWKYTFEQVPKYDKDGEEIVYTVEETPVNGFKVVVNGLNITNTYGGEITPTPIVTPQVSPGVIPQVSPGVTPQVSPGVTPQVSPGVTPQVSPGVTPQVSPEVTPQVSPEVTPQVSPGVTPQVSPGVTPQVSPGVTPQVSPGVTPQVSPSVTPQVSPGVTPQLTPNAELTVTPTAPTVTPGVLGKVTTVPSPTTSPSGGNGSGGQGSGSGLGGTSLKAPATVGGANGGQSSSAKTGDTAQVVLWAGIAVAGLGAVGASAYALRKKLKKDAENEDKASK